MAYLASIINHLEQAFQIKIHGHFQPRTEIEGVCFYIEANTFETPYMDKLLYLDSFSVDFPKNPPQNLLLLSCLDKPLNYNILYCKEALSLAEVLNCIQEMILKHYALKLKREELFLALHNDCGIEGMTHVARSFLENPITICDTSFSVIASSSPVKDTSNLIEKHGRTYLKDPLFQNMAEQNIIQRIYTSYTPFLTTLDDYPYKWAFKSIRIHHAVVGYVCVRGIVRDFTEDDLEFIHAFSQMVSIELQKDSSYRHPTGMKYEYFLTELLEGHFERTEYITSHLIQLGRTQMPYYTILLITRKDLSHNLKNFKEYFEQLLFLLPNCMVVLFHGNLTILLPSETSEPFSEKNKSRFLTFLQLNQMQAFMSYPFTDISKSNIYYRQVKDLSGMLEKITFPMEEPFISYETFFLEHCLFQCGNSSILHASIHPDIARMLTYDNSSNTEYTRTLRVYLAENRNALTAAKQLHIHKSTFFYRLGKMSDLFSIDINDGLTLFAYEYSFRVLDYLERL